MLKELPTHPDYRKDPKLTAPLRANLMTALDALEKGKPVLLQRFREAEEGRLRLEQRSREAGEARRREEEARSMAARAAKSQEEARRTRLLEMQKLDMENSYKTRQDLLMKRSNEEVTIPALQPSRFTPPPITPKDGYPTTSSISVPEYPAPISITPPKAASISVPKPRAQCTSCSAIVLTIFVDYLENGMPLRKVSIPDSIVHRFLDLAAHNTRRNLETCGVLAGKLSHDEFTITTLIIPKQTATSDTVAMLNEEEILEVADQRDLMTLGWIHTHPTQQCFMSSVDLHTHFPYQLLMAEALAIVVAPTQTPKYAFCDLFIIFL